MNSARSLTDLRAATSMRLRARREEINRAVIQRALAVAPPTGLEDSGYLEELRGTITRAVEHAFEAIELGEERLGPTPTVISLQASAAARSKVGLEVVLRRYASGYSTLTDFLHQEVRALDGDFHYPALQRELTGLFDRLVAEVSEAYVRGEEKAVPSSRQRRLERVRRLLAGDFVVTSGLDYDFAVWHQALIARHHDGAEVLRGLAATLDRRLLLVEVDDTTSWAWFGGRSPFEPEELRRIANYDWPNAAVVASGTPSRGIGGWQLTHRRASRALSVAARSPTPFATYEEVAMQAAILSDADLVEYLEESILAPLSDTRDGGEALRNTLRIYFELGHSVSSTASALRISRQTVAARLRAVEGALGRTINACRLELEAALTIEAVYK
jgi:hypothetical protein